MFFNCFSLDELDLIISGDNKFDWNELKNAAIYVGFDENSQVVVWFWKYFMELEEENKINVLKFITGSSSIPTEGISSIHLKITILRENDCLPSIHTCFNEILLPEFASFDELKQKCNLTFAHL